MTILDGCDGFCVDVMNCYPWLVSSGCGYIILGVCRSNYLCRCSTSPMDGEGNTWYTYTMLFCASHKI